MELPITSIVRARNEELQIADCLESVRGLGDVLVVDSLSTDRTVKIAEAHGARVIQHDFVNYAAQRNFAQAQAQTDWVFFVDADERVSDKLRQEIQELSLAGTLADNEAYHIRRVHLISGTWFPDLSKLKYSDLNVGRIRRREVPRLLSRTHAVWERALHETVNVAEPHGVLNGVLYHYAATNLSLMFESLNEYTDREAALLHRTRHSVTMLEAALRGSYAFLQCYLGWGRWKAGEAGLMHAAQLGFTKFLNYAKLSERLRIARKEGEWMPGDRDLLDRFDSDSRPR